MSTSGGIAEAGFRGRDDEQGSYRIVRHLRDATNVASSARLRSKFAMARQSKETRTAPLSARTTPTIKPREDRFALEDDHSVTQITEQRRLAEAAQRDAPATVKRK
jgi:hypothetical protein